VAPKSELPGVGSAWAVSPPTVDRVEPASSPAAEDVKNERRSMRGGEPERKSGETRTAPIELGRRLTRPRF
jgi:hypothetical protein